MLDSLRQVEERGAVESAHRIKGICSQIFRFAIFSGIIESDPTRDLRGALAKPPTRHLAAITNPTEVPGLLQSIHSYHGTTEVKTAMLLGILTFVRPGNLRQAEWSEFHNLDKPEMAEWRIPCEKMKVSTGRDFIVPLAPQAVALINKIRPETGFSQYLFPSPRSDKRPMSANGVLSALRRMGYTSDEMTGHGVRAMARTICAEVLDFQPEVIEEQLAHQKPGALRDANDRTQYLKQRRKLMNDWAAYLDQLAPGVFSSRTSVASAGKEEIPTKVAT